MYLTRHQTYIGPRWALDGKFLPGGLDLAGLLALSKSQLNDVLKAVQTSEAAVGDLLPPIEASQEVWACGVTYLRSRDARKEESQSAADAYDKVYDAERPEIFFKSAGWRAVGHGVPIRIRKDSSWNVPEPELTLVINAGGEIVGYTVGNDVSSRDIEGENPLYLPQAKSYTGSCAVGPGIQIADVEGMTDLPIHLVIERDGKSIFDDTAATSQMKRTPTELVSYLYRELSFPHGALLMTGTCLVPGGDFTLTEGDLVRITVGERTLENRVE
jgi:2-dehydro-3-deoxy-D-arabinonate dehydratase